MTDPGQPFQPPRPPHQPPPGSGGPPPAGGEGSFRGWQSLLAVIGGLGLGLVMPVVIGSVLGVIVGATAAPDWVTVIVALAGAVGLTVGGFILVIGRLDGTSPTQASVKTSLKTAGYISLAMWAGFLLLFGVCIALISGYGT